MKLALCWRIVNGSLTWNIDPRAFGKVGLAIYQSWETFFKCGQLARYTTAVPKCAFRDGRAELAQYEAVTWHNCNRSVDHSARNWLLVFRVMQLWIQGGGVAMVIGAYTIFLNKSYRCRPLFWYRRKQRANERIRHSDKKALTDLVLWACRIHTQEQSAATWCKLL